MLVLSRKKGERVIIGQEVEVTVLEIRAGKVRLGFAGPPEVSIHREEVAERIKQSERAGCVPACA